MPDSLGKLKEYGSLLSTGLLHQMAPKIAGGILNEMFHNWNVTIAKITDDVQRDRSIWDELEPDQRKQLITLARRIGNINFFTPGLVIHSIKKDFPGVASLFLNWPEAQDWLERQVEQLKTEVYGEAE